MSHIELVPEVYISYAWETQPDGSNWMPIIKKLYEALTNESFKVHIDINRLKYKDNIKSFMQELGKGKYIICVINEKYLHSFNCMYEVLQILKNPQYIDRIFPIVLKDAKIYDSKKTVQYLLHWESSINDLNNDAKSLSSPAYAAPIFEDIEIMNEIRNVMAKFGDEIGSMNVLTPETHDTSNFRELIDTIKDKVKIDNSNINLQIENISLKKQIVSLKNELQEITSKYELLIIQESEKKIEAQLSDTNSTIITDYLESNKSKILDFENFIGFNRYSTVDDIIKVFGEPHDSRDNLKYDFITIYYENLLDVSYFRKSRKIMVLRLRAKEYSIQKLAESISFISDKSINDPKTSYLGMHRDDILKEFGVPDSTSSDNYTYYINKIQVNFICYAFNEYVCGEIDIHYFE